MADISDINAASATKIVGSDATGVEQTPVQSTAGGSLHANLRNNAGTEIASTATAPTPSVLGMVVRPLPHQPATFTTVAQAIAIGNAKHMISIMNGVGSTVLVKILEIKIINTQTAAITGIVADFRALRISGHSAGTAVASSSYDLNDTLSASVTVLTNGTIAGLSTVPLFRRLYSTDEWGTGTLDKEGSDQIHQNLHPTWKAIENAKPITLRAGQGLTIQQLINSVAGTFDIEIIYTTESL